ncbi:MAG: STAS domain-containing protein [Parachlamydia sp.]|nr:STAS domain-containing protein [Parachlamydia sp.]
MPFSHAILNDVLIITLDGERLDAHVATDFKQKVIELLSSIEQKHVIFDLHALHFIDSSGLSAFLSILRTLHHKGGELKLASLNKPVRMVFELVSMHKIFEIYDTTDAAERSIMRKGE